MGRTTNRGAEPARPPEGLNFRAAYAEAIRQACLIARDLDYARVDSFWNGRELYAGEITIYPSAGIPAIGNAGVARLLRPGWRLDESYFLRGTDLWWAERRYAQAMRRAMRREADQESSFPAISSNG